MRPEDAAQDPRGLARALIADNSYLTLATADLAGVPWATPVWFAHRELEMFVWASKPAARHSRNISANPGVSLVIFDSAKAPGEGSALYVSADAALVDERDLQDALVVYNAKSRKQGLGEWDPANLRDPAPHRLYRAVAREAFVLDDHDERVEVT
ncbi:pyridoxamine 5'-phosphate oxidase family protein [Microbacterium lushaniae]|uniref:Pyridoxamine 5'-phosphate oxidase family protein n=1 Tax=Microbacterium lushaniae TaxID=2614639 RepID=A0A5J6L3T8_9MICO|nr:pyridoxamine 5'-phosphate oxidase family protein [Microbacterium lushaniae]QEW03051.1 pyridoxamine 5'-phosphate oxidase family protein [Microbacterium lushaniae]